VHAKAGPASAGPGERARLSAAAGSLLDRRGDVCRREEPPRYESGLRAHGSNQRFHRLLGHAVARALTTAPSLTDLTPAAARILIPQGWRRKGPPGSLSRKPGSRRSVCGAITTRAASESRRAEKRRYIRRFSSNVWRKALRGGSAQPAVVPRTQSPRFVPQPHLSCRRADARGCGAVMRRRGPRPVSKFAAMQRRIGKVNEER
jgi:hypothetical protein